MNKEKMAIILLLASLVVTNLGWFYFQPLQTGGTPQTNEFDGKILDLMDKNCNIRLLYQHSFEKYRQSYETQGYNFKKVTWKNFNDKLNEYEERKGLKAVTIHPDGKAFSVHGVNTTIYYYQIE